MARLPAARPRRLRPCASLKVGHTRFTVTIKVEQAQPKEEKQHNPSNLYLKQEPASEEEN